RITGQLAIDEYAVCRDEDRFAQRGERTDRAWWTELHAEPFARKPVHQPIELNGLGFLQHVPTVTDAVFLPRLQHRQALFWRVIAVTIRRGIPWRVVAKLLFVEQQVVFPGPLPILHFQRRSELWEVDTDADVR